MRKLLLILVVILLISPLSWGQRADVDSLLQKAESSYNNALYEDAELTARRLLEYQDLRNIDRITCERLIASSLIAQGKPQPARDHFISILRIDPSFELDPVITSPKILSVFVETKRNFAPARSADSSLYIARDLKPPISYRAVLFPGWEQIHRGRAQMGAVFATLGAVSLGTGLATEFLRSSARKDYLSATTQNDITEKYKTYNRYYRAETYSFIVFALTYVASEIDLFTSGTQSLEVHAGPGRHESANLTLILRF
jgi:tetratricopeptide (TPR) repeat protein